MVSNVTVLPYHTMILAGAEGLVSLYPLRGAIIDASGLQSRIDRSGRFAVVVRASKLDFFSLKSSFPVCRRKRIKLVKLAELAMPDLCNEARNRPHAVAEDNCIAFDIH
jgi:hypothetical protein